MKNEIANNTTINRNNIPKGWKRVKLGEVADLLKIPWKVGDENLPYIGLEHIEENKLRLSGVGNSNDITSNKFLFTENEFLFGKLRPYFRKLYKPKFKGICSTDIWVINSKTNTNKEFLFYLFANQDFVDLAYKGASGTRMPRADWNFMFETEWLIPKSKNEQKAIASVLSSLDDKIDLLHRQNKTLEAMAETLFRQWFVPARAGEPHAGGEEAKEDWKEKMLDEIVDIAIGRTPPRKEFHWFSTNPTDIKWVSIKDLGNSGVFVYDTAEYLTQDAVHTFNIPVIPENTILLSFKMTIGRVGITTEEMLSNEAIAHFVFTEKTPFCKEYLYFFLKLFKYDTLGSTSSIVTSINSRMIKEMEILVPDKNTMSKFEGIVREFFNKIKHNQLQIRTLEKLRDTLLPKLISGEVWVQYDKEATI